MAKRRKTKSKTSRKSKKTTKTGQSKKRTSKSQSSTSNLPTRDTRKKLALSPLLITILGLGLLISLLFFGQDWFRSAAGKNEAPASNGSERLSFPSLDSALTGDDIQFADYVGSEACASCHAEEFNQWRNSTHAHAGGPADAQHIIGKFDGRPRSFKDATVIPYRRGDNYYFDFKIQDVPATTFKVDAVVGGGHMIGGGTQTYFSTFPDGTLRFLPFDFIRDEQVWFGETDKGRGWIPVTEDLSVSELSEFPPNRVLGSHSLLENCQECHGSQINVTYDEESKKYETQYTTLAINCESCHGPGRRHIEIISSSHWDTLTDIGMTALGTLDKDASLNVCFRCHALKDALEPGYLQGKDLESHYSLKSPIIGENPYHPDGRIRAFGYQQNHLFSDCYLNGSMTCVDCHDPHDQSYRDFNGMRLKDPFDDGQCTGCHASKAVNPIEHTHHELGSTGSKCVNCHMPYLQHQAMGDQLKFTRSDHTIPIPRPAFDARLGIENACSKCHPEHSIEWLQQKTVEWYGELKPHKDWVTNLLEAEDASNLKQAGELLLNDTSGHVIGQMMSLSTFLNDHLRPDMEFLEQDVVEQIQKFVESPDLDVKSVAMASLHLSQDHNPVIHNYLVEKLESLSKAESSKVRKRWATILPYFAKKYEMSQNFQDAISTYLKALDVLPGNAAVLSNLGYTYQRMGELSQAKKYYRRAINADPHDAMGWVNLGNAQNNNGETEAAVRSYQKAININSWNSVAHFNLGNHYYRTNDLKRAITYYQQAIERDPALAICYFNLTRAYIKTQDFEKAFAAVKAGLYFDPTDTSGQQMKKDLEDAFRRAGLIQ